jgi:hypothetical protein
MSSDLFSERMARIQKRFASKLAAKIEETDACLSDLAGDGSTTIDSVKAAYLRFHEMAGIGPTIGFEETGRVAQVLDTVLLDAYRAGRGLMPQEMTKAKDGLVALRAAAQADLKSFDAECLP